jgi:hypothetical protein
VLASNNFITYKQKYIFELLKREENVDYISLSSHKDSSSTKSINMGVNLFLLNDSNYFSIDTFSLDAKVLKYEGVNKKKLGMSIPTVKHNTISRFGFSYPKDTIINNNKYFYIDTTINNVDSTGDITYAFFFIRQDNFFSYLNNENIKFLKHNFSFVGFSQTAKKGNYEAMWLLESIKPLTKEQMKICNFISLKAYKFK